MEPLNRKTRFEPLNRRQAAGVVGALFVAIGACLVVTIVQPNRVDPFHFEDAPPVEGSVGGSNDNDLKLYRRIVERVHSGERYYDAAGAELKAGGYPTGSMFNWRPPTYAWVNGSLPDLLWGKVLIGALAAIALLLMFSHLTGEGGLWMGVLAGVFAVGFFGWVLLGDAYLVQEFWAGTLIALSIGAYARGYWQVGLAVGLAALFYRELALAYCLVAVVLAWREGRRLEVGLWLAGFAAFAAFLVFHGSQVARHAADAQRGQVFDWLELGGLAFVLKTCRTNLFLLALPAWVTALFLPLALLGLIGWRGPVGQRTLWTALLYLAAFAVVGRSFNYYWGMLIAPLLAMGLVWGIVVVYDLVQALRIGERRGVSPPCTTV